jgi:hypothetical protein
MSPELDENSVGIDFLVDQPYRSSSSADGYFGI